MNTIIVLCQIFGLLLLWAIFSALLIPLAIIVWVLKSVMRGLEWVRDKATGEV